MDPATMINGMEGSWTLGVAVIGFAVGIAAGFLLSLLPGGSKGQVRKLESDLEETRAQLSQYQSQVQKHFSRTSDLFQDVTERYRSLYDHLSEGAQDLCGNLEKTALPDLPEKSLLAAGEPETGTAAAGKEDAPTGPETKPAAEAGTQHKTGETPEKAARSAGL